MMLDHLGEPDAAAAVLAAVETVLASGGEGLTPDMGGTATTQNLGKAVADSLTGP
jgi:tartrate dehydrogenase/decarboxylase/D-malate dehydrogenase